jgi:hypothetical protein
VAAAVPAELAAGVNPQAVRVRAETSRRADAATVVLMEILFNVFSSIVGRGKMEVLRVPQPEMIITRYDFIRALQDQNQRFS